MATTTIAAGKINPEAVSKGMLTALNNQAGLSVDQQDRAKPIIEKHVADLEAVKNDATLVNDLCHLGIPAQSCNLHSQSADVEADEDHHGLPRRFRSGYRICVHVR